jgi:Zn-finger nucleic acid-binding protein
MRCSVDNTDLIDTKSEDKRGWVCHKCSGAWLPSKFVNSFGDTLPFFVGDFYEQLAINTTSTSERECPEGHGPLDCAHYGRIELDWCADCEGVWFDNGELKAVATIAASDQPDDSWPTIFLESIQAFWPFEKQSKEV